MKHADEYCKEEHLEEDDEDHGLREAQETAANLTRTFHAAHKANILVKGVKAIYFGGAEI